MDPGASDALLPDKEFFNIGEACRILGIPAYTLRYWETLFRSLRPTRRNGGHRRYARADMASAFLIKDLLRNKKMTVAGARKALAERIRGGRPVPEGGSANPGAMKLLREVREDLLRLAAELSAPAGKS